MRALLAVLALSVPSAAQLTNGTVGPNPVPIGCDVSITVSNDSPFIVGTGPCPFAVFDAQQNPVYQPTCRPIIIDMGPYGWSTSTWDQRDQGGQQVPPGLYWIRVDYEFEPSTFHPVQVGGTDAGLVFEGTATIGQTFTGEARHFYLCAPQDGGFLYFLAAAVTATVGVPTCGGVLPLDPDPLFFLTLTPNTLFQGSVGTLSPNGTSTTPTFPIPNDPGLVGISLVAGYAVLDPSQPCIIRRISEPYSLQIISG